MAAGAVGASAIEGPAPLVAAAAVLLEVLGRRRMDPDLAGRTEACWACGWDCVGLWTLAAAPPLATLLFSGGILSPMPWSSRMKPWPVGDGNWVSLKSDSKLLCKSSKLTWGRKSKEAGVLSVTSVGGCAAAPFLPNENRE